MFSFLFLPLGCAHKTRCTYATDYGVSGESRLGGSLLLTMIPGWIIMERVRKDGKLCGGTGHAQLLLLCLTSVLTCTCSISRSDAVCTTIEQTADKTEDSSLS